MATTFMVFYIDQIILIQQKLIQQFVMFMVDHLFKLSEILLNYLEPKGKSSKNVKKYSMKVQILSYLGGYRLSHKKRIYANCYAQNMPYINCIEIGIDAFLV